MEGQPGDGKREIERFKGMQYRRNMQGGKKEKQLEGWKEAKKYRIGKSNGNGGQKLGIEKEAGHSKISCQVPEV